MFTNNNKLRIVNLRTNNINLMTPAMMSDFSSVSFLAIGANNFVCDCSLRDFIDRAAFNAMYYQCSNNQRMKRSTFDDEKSTGELDHEQSTFGFDDPAYYYDHFTRKFHRYIEYVEESYQNILGVEINLMTRRQVAPSAGCSEIKNKDVDSNMNFNFLLLDYSENDYHCVKSNGQAKSKGKGV